MLEYSRGELINEIELNEKKSLLEEIPLEVVDITLQTLKKNYDYWGECEMGLNLAKTIMNIEKLAKVFIESGGLEEIYEIFINY